MTGPRATTVNMICTIIHVRGAVYVRTTVDLLNTAKVNTYRGAQWLSGRVLGLRPRVRGFEPHRRHFVVSLSKIINPSLVLVQPRKTRPFITERLLMGRKELNQTNKTKYIHYQ